MATRITMTHPNTNLLCTAYVGYSWTTLFFGPFVALIRGDLVGFIVAFIAVLFMASFTLGLGGIFVSAVWAVFYNRYHARKLIELGYHLDPQSQWASELLGIRVPTSTPSIREDPPRSERRIDPEYRMRIPT